MRSCSGIVVGVIDEGAAYASQEIESAIYAPYVLQNKPTAKVAVLYQNDD